MEEREFQAQLKEKTEEIEAILQRFLPKEEGFARTVAEAMNYSLMAGGKRLRPMLMQETYRMFGGTDSLIEPYMAAIEMIHTYSLVHDDLPAMDNDEYRRGRKTTWAVYGEGMGVLAGDGLLNYALETALGAFPLDEDILSGNVQLAAGKMQAAARALYILVCKSGIYGMIGGQCADIEAEGQSCEFDMERLLFIHAHKTAALIQAAMMVGAVLAGASESKFAAVSKCAYNIGIAFQIQDDILDVTGDSGQLGKPVGSDALNRKQTYVTLKGLEQSEKDVERLSREAVELLEGMEGNHDFLGQLIVHLIHRNH